MSGLARTSTSEELSRKSREQAPFPTSFNFPQFRRHLDLDDSALSLNAVSQDKKSASVRQADIPTNFNPI